MIEQLNNIELDSLYENTEAKSFNIAEVKLGEFISFCMNPSNIVDYVVKLNLGNITEEIAILKGITDSIRQVMTLLEKWNDFDLKPIELQAQKGVQFPSVFENMLLDCVEFYNLHSLEEAEELSFSNYILLAKRKLANQRYERNYNKLLDKQYSSANKNKG